MADDVARGGIGSLRAPCGASGTRYVPMRGLITYFRFRSVTDLRRLARALHLPPSFSVGSGKHTYLFTGEEGLLILLHRMSYPCTLSRMCWESGRGTTALSLGFRWMNEYIYNNFRHLHDDRSLLAWEPHFERFARAVYQKARGPDGSGIGLQNCVGFIDGTVQRVARPGSSYKCGCSYKCVCESACWASPPRRRSHDAMVPDERDTCPNECHGTSRSDTHEFFIGQTPHVYVTVHTCAPSGHRPQC
jgi:hypothetical protein